ncbi:EF-hand domain-containing protein [Phyllobacterium zundukense]|jgi:Ca2+-binding EF-hand superfamily protein|uniref:Calcium-binding protein n=1 Tax=Phyllobacterium zundukense TaxID=1867719 RepID=A0ACD4CZM0_9HYPH|nr:calcium-binding protein [Phyllobacterium zundukense]UXN59076.1 calcium-binding protein [Phyllobacterium zundukense]
MKRILALVLSGTFLTVFAVSGVFAQTETPAQAQTPAAAAQTKPASDSNTAKPMQGKMDKNDDGAVDLSEFTNMDRLKQADTNGDGTLSQDEIQAMVMKRIVERQARRMTNRLDVNGDGVVTIAEVEKQKEKRFALMDRNDDGKLERSELRHGKDTHKGHERRGHQQHRENGNDEN